jgi:phage head maturation protease
LPSGRVIKDGDIMETKFETDIGIKEVKEEERSFIAWASKGTLDRDQEIIDPSGWDLTNYNKNKVVALNHVYFLPVAKAQWIKPDPKDVPIGLLFKPIYAKTLLGDDVFYLYKEEFMSGFSVGFDPKEWEVDGQIFTKSLNGDFAIWQKGYVEQKRKKPRCKYLKQELLEVSCVMIPAHPDALVESRKHIKSPELTEYIDEMINKSRKPMIPVEIDYKQKYIDSLEIISEQAQAILKKQKDADVIDSQDFDDNIAIDDDDIDLDDLLGSDGDALAESGNVSEVELVEMLAGSGDDAVDFNLEDY